MEYSAQAKALHAGTDWAALCAQALADPPNPYPLLTALNRWSILFEHGGQSETRQRVFNEFQGVRTMQALKTIEAQISRSEFSPSFENFPKPVQRFFRRIAFPKVPQAAMDTLEHLIESGPGRFPALRDGGNHFRRNFSPRALSEVRGRPPKDVAQFYAAREAWFAASFQAAHSAYSTFLKAISNDNGGMVAQGGEIFGVTFNDIRKNRRRSSSLSRTALLKQWRKLGGSGVSAEALRDFLRGIKGGRKKSQR
jgi:hypothetical protein